MRSLHLSVRLRVGGERFGDGISFRELREVAQRCEQLGLDGCYVTSSDAHSDNAASIIDPYVVLGACAVATTRITLGCCPTPNDGRSASVLAKIATGLDVVSDGRAVVVVAAPQLANEAARAVVSEQLEVLRAMSRVVAPSFHGEHFTINRAWNEPRIERDETLPLGLFISSDDITSVNGDEVPVIDLSARFCSMTVVVINPDTNHDAVIATITERCRRAGRLRSSMRIIALVHDVVSNPIAATTATINQVIAAGYDGVMLDAGEMHDINGSHGARFIAAITEMTRALSATS